MAEGMMMVRVHEVDMEKKIFITTPEDPDDDMDLYIIYAPGTLSYSRLGIVGSGYREILRRADEANKLQEVEVQSGTHPLLGQTPEQGSEETPV